MNSYYMNMQGQQAIFYIPLLCKTSIYKTRLYTQVDKLKDLELFLNEGESIMSLGKPFHSCLFTLKV